MKAITLNLLLLLIFTSCKEIDLGDLDGEQEVLINKIKGDFSKCGPSPVYSGYYQKTDVTITNDTLTLLLSTHGSSNCTDPYGHSRQTFTIKKLATNSSDSSLIDIDLIALKVELYPTHSYYPSQNYCGIVGMPQNQYTDLTGLSCPTYLSADSHHTSMPATGDLKYSTIKLVDADTIAVNTGFTESGDSPSERQVSDLAEADRI